MDKFELTAINVTSRRAKVIDDFNHVSIRLNELHADLSIGLLSDVIVAGLNGRNDVSPGSAPTAPGIQQWLKSVESVRTVLGRKQWNGHNQLNCPFISSPNRAVSIVVMTGSPETGKNGSKDPINQAEKGAVTESITRKNQLELFNQEAFKQAKGEHKGTEVWVLLYHYDKSLHEVRYELSFPTGFGNKKINQWGERLILGSIPDNPSEFKIKRDEPNAPATVEVEPKSMKF